MISRSSSQMWRFRRSRRIPGVIFFHVYIYSCHLIQKRQIRQMEQRIKDQLFSKVRSMCRSRKSTPCRDSIRREALLREYRDSIILELKERSILASNMFAQAKIHYEDGNVVCLELLDSIVSEGRKEEILAFLENLFTRRFHMKADIRITYREADGEGLGSTTNSDPAGD